MLSPRKDLVTPEHAKPGRVPHALLDAAALLGIVSFALATALIVCHLFIPGTP